jgi:hypothetical protein
MGLEPEGVALIPFFAAKKRIREAPGGHTGDTLECLEGLNLEATVPFVVNTVKFIVNIASCVLNTLLRLLPTCSTCSPWTT